jgi:hypothetical protein
MRRNRDLPGIALDNALVLACELHAQDAEVGSSEVQRVEQPLFTPRFSSTECKSTDYAKTNLRINVNVTSLRISYSSIHKKSDK